MHEGKDILIVDDDLIVRNVYANALTSKGYHVVQAGDVDSGLAAFLDDKPDLVILDLILPMTDGYRFLKEIKSDPENHALPVIVVSNLDESVHRQKAIDLGAVEYLVKADTGLQVIADAVERHIGHA